MDEGPGDVVGEVTEALGDAAQVPESSVDGLGGAVGGAWDVEGRARGV